MKSKSEKLQRTRIQMLAFGIATIMTSGMTPGLAAAQNQEILIGAVLPLTGPAARIGLEQQNGLEFALEKINSSGGIKGKKVRIVYEDSQAKPDQGVLAFNRLVDLHQVPAIITAYSSVTLAIAPLATRKKVLVINPAAQTNKLATASPFLVNTIPLVKDEVSVIAKYAANKIGKRAAILYENAAVGIDLREEFIKEFTSNGGSIVADEGIEFGSTNVRPFLQKIVAAKPDFVFKGITSGPGVVTDQEAQVPGLPISVGTSFFVSLVGLPIASGWYHSSVKSTVAPDIEKQFITKFNTKDMGFFSREYANAAQILFQVIDSVIQNGRPMTGENLKTALFEKKTYETSNGKLSFDGNTAKREIEIYKLTPPGRTLVQSAQ